MANSLYEALLGALLRERDEKGRVRILEVEALEYWLHHRGLEDFKFRLEPLLRTLTMIRMLKKKKYTELGFAIGRKDIPLSLDEILRDLLR